MSYNSQLKNKSRFILGLVFVVIFLFVDLLSKQIVLSHIPLWHYISINSFFGLTHVNNHGASFSFLASDSGWQKYLFLLIGLSVLIFLLTLMLKNKNLSLTFAYSLIIAGDLGNNLNRIHYGYVIDFISFHFNNYYFPIFNFADSFITIGVILIILKYIRKK
ncbi:MAG: signal peptidase II [Psittacicella sp.]